MVTSRNNSSDQPVVFVVDDDEGVRKSLQALASSAGLLVETFASAEEFLAHFDPSRSGCLILDVRLGDTSGLDLQEELTKRGSSLPVIVISGYGTIPGTVRAMRGGAIDFLQKPFSPKLLLDRIREAIELDRANRSKDKKREQIQSQLRELTPREAEVLEHIKLGLTSREIAEILRLSPRTVEGHRQVILRKMGAGSAAQLIHLLMSVE